MGVGNPVIPITPDHSLLTQFEQVVDIALVAGRNENGIVTRLQIEIDVGPIGNFLRPRDGVFKPWKGGVHFVRCADIKLIAVHPHAIRVAAFGLGIHAQQHILHRGVFTIQVVRIVGGHERQPHPLSQLNSPLGTTGLDLETGVLNLQIEAVAKDLRVPRRELFCLFHLLAQQQVRQFTRSTSGQADDPIAMGLQQFLVDAGLVVEAFDKGPRRHLHQVLETLTIDGQQREVEAGFLGSSGTRLYKP